MSTPDIVVLEGARTPIGSFGGVLRDLSATDLGVIAGKAALERSGVNPTEVDHVVFGNVLQTSKDAIYLARHVGLKSGAPIETPALTVNRLCGSGLQAIVSGAQMLQLGEATTVLAGGTESMSQSPHVIRGARWGLALGEHKLEDYLWEALPDTYNGLPMAITAENLADRYSIPREEQDQFSYRSQQTAAVAMEKGWLAEEIVPVELPGRKGEVIQVTRDEYPRPQTTLEALAKLPPRFRKNGCVTAGNASGIVDGAAAVVITTADRAEAAGRRPLGRLVSWATVGVDPDIMGIGPAPAIRLALKRADLKLSDMAVVEINEAFAAQILACLKDLELPWDNVNPNGGAIALGHPLGMSGARLALTLLHELRRRGARYGVAALCIGGGQGIAAIFENLAR